MDPPASEGIRETFGGVVQPAGLGEDAVDAAHPDAGGLEGGEGGPGRVEQGPLDLIGRGPRTELQDVGDEGLEGGRGSGGFRERGGVEDHPPGRFGDKGRSGWGDVEAAIVAPVHVTPDQQQEGEPWEPAQRLEAGNPVGNEWTHRRCKNVGQTAGSLGFGMHFAD